MIKIIKWKKSKFYLKKKIATLKNKKLQQLQP
jgi:hypothetical protein